MEPFKAQLLGLYQRMEEVLSSLGVSVLLHGVLLVLLLWVGSTAIEQPKPAPATVPVIQAHAVDGRQLEARAERKRREQEAKERKEQERREAARRKQQELKRRAEEKKKAEEQRKAAAEEAKRAAALEKKRKAEEQRRLATELKKKKQKEAKRKKAAEEKKKRVAEKRRAEALKKRRDAERKRAEEEAQRKAEQQRRDEAARAKLNAELEAEMEQELLQSSQRQSVVGRELAQLKATIRLQIERIWKRPPGTPPGRTCKVQVRLLPGGGVGSVTILQSSGNEVFDASVEQAVRMAAPFPYPDSVELRNELRELEMTFRHEG